jgi:hypothetical protein
MVFRVRGFALLFLQLFVLQVGAVFPSADGVVIDS